MCWQDGMQTPQTTGVCVCMRVCGCMTAVNLRNEHAPVACMTYVTCILCSLIPALILCRYKFDETQLRTCERRNDEAEKENDDEAEKKKCHSAKIAHDLEDCEIVSVCVVGSVRLRQTFCGHSNTDLCLPVLSFAFGVVICLLCACFGCQS